MKDAALKRYEFRIANPASFSPEPNTQGSYNTDPMTQSSSILDSEQALKAIEDGSMETIIAMAQDAVERGELDSSKSGEQWLKDANTLKT